MWPVLFHTSNSMSQMDEFHRHTRPRNPTSAGLLFSRGFCCGSDNERSVLWPSWFRKARRSNRRAVSVDGCSENGCCKGWNSVGRARGWSQSAIDAAGLCCSGPIWKRVVRMFKKDGKPICSSKPSRFRYDPLSYKLNFDDGFGQGHDYWLQGLSSSVVQPGKSTRSPSMKP